MSRGFLLPSVFVLLLSLQILLLHPSSLFAQSVAQQEQQAIQQAVAEVNPSIARIETVGGVDLIGEILTGTGPTTGVVISEDGYIITSRFNFVAKPTSVLVTLFQNQESKKYAAAIVAHDESKMLTLLKIEASGLKPILASNKQEAKVGQRAIALGRTFDVEFPNVSTGIISALNRVNGKALQTDAKTSPVNYGGPLIDLYGRCLGIIVPLSPQEEGESAGVEWYDSGIGFAIPLEDIERVVDRMKAGEDLKAGLLGVGFEAAGPLSGAAKVLRVRPKSPADESGIEVGDVITQIDGTEIQRLINLRQVLGNRYAGETLKVVVTRADQTIEKEIQLVGELSPYEFQSLGVLPDRIALGMEPAGVGVRYVFAESGAAQGGVQAGDLIKSIDGQSVASPLEIGQILSAKLKNEKIELLVLRGEQELTLQAVLSEFPNGDGLTSIPPADIPPGDVSPDLKLGRFNQKLAGSERTFWVNVPENYNPKYQHGMLVWVHPSGETKEAELLRFWKDLCDEYGILLIGPRAEDLSGWSATDEEHVKDIVEWVKANYSIDSQRVAVAGLEDSAVFATRLAFKYREFIRGLICFESPLRFPPPDSHPEQRLLIAFVSALESPQRKRIEKSVEVLREQKFPTTLIDSEEAGKFSLDLVNSLVQWLDSLDRL